MFRVQAKGFRFSVRCLGIRVSGCKVQAFRAQGVRFSS